MQCFFDLRVRHNRIEDLFEFKRVTWISLEDNPDLVFNTVLGVNRDRAIHKWELFVFRWGLDLLEITVKSSAILNFELKYVFIVQFEVLNYILDESKDEESIDLSSEMSPLEQPKVIIRCDPTLLLEKLSLVIDIENILTVGLYRFENVGSICIKVASTYSLGPKLDVTLSYLCTPENFLFNLSLSGNIIFKYSFAVSIYYLSLLCDPRMFLNLSKCWPLIWILAKHSME